MAIEMKFSKEQIESVKEAVETYGLLTFSDEQLAALRKMGQETGARFLGDFLGGMGNRLPAEYHCIRDGHRMIHVKGYKYKCRICGREFMDVDMLETGQLWAEFWRRINVKRRLLGVGWLFSDFLRELEKVQGWR